MKKIAILSIITSFIFAQQSALDYLNEIRTNAGLVKFSKNPILDEASQNHADYMAINNIADHYEDENNVGFTGVTPSDRAVAAGYSSLYVKENLSWGQSNEIASIDGLMSAIYHRFTFLSLDINEIGIGSKDIYYNYDMGNSYLNELCQGESDSSGYYNICADRNKIIATNKYNDAINKPKKEAKDIILWPYPNAKNILPAFYSEVPDPLPNYDVSGYPISVEFNDLNYTNPDDITISNFAIYDSNNNALETIFMDKNSDPQNKFTNTQFAIFPKKRLEWGSRYYAKLDYTYNNKNYTKSWCFSTKPLDAQGVYKLYDNAELNVISAKKYAIYFVPRDGNDTLGDSRYEYTSSLDVNYTKVDGNTFYLILKGNIGDYVKFTFSNGIQMKFIVANSDTANTPKNETCSQDYTSQESSSNESSTDNLNSNDTTNTSDTTLNNNIENSAQNTTNERVTTSSGASFNSLGVLFMLSSLFLLTFIRKENS